MEQPNNIEAERNVIGAALLSGSAATEAMQELNPGDFFCEPYARLFKAIGALSIAGKPVTAQTVAVEVGTYKTADDKSVLEEMGGPQFIYRTLEGVDPNEIRFWVEEVAKKKALRDLVEFAEMAKQTALGNPKDIKKARSKIEERLAKLTGGLNKDVVAVSDTAALKARIERYEQAPDAITGIETGWDSFDRMIDGFQPGNVTIVYAPSSRFKSMFVANIGWKLAQNGHAGLWFTTEMPFLQVQERLLQIHTGLNFRHLRRERKMGAFTASIDKGIREVGQLPIHICDSSELEIGTIRGMVNRYKKWHDVKYAIIDLVDMVSTAQFKDDSVAQQSQVMRQLKGIAKSANIHIILVSHISKGEKQMHKQAFLSPEDMKGSSSKFQDVDAAISLMPVRTDSETGQWVGLSLEELTDRVKSDGQLNMLVTFTKNRHGELGGIPFIVSINNGGRIFPLGRSQATQNVVQGRPWNAPFVIPENDEYEEMDEEEFDEVTGIADAA